MGCCLTSLKAKSRIKYLRRVKGVTIMDKIRNEDRKCVLNVPSVMVSVNKEKPAIHILSL